MAKIRIMKKDGTPSRFFWLDRDGGDRTNETLYRETEDGVKRIRGVHFNAVTNRVRKD